MTQEYTLVLNLVINGLPSILTLGLIVGLLVVNVLNLVINGLPSILHKCNISVFLSLVLNLVINGLPSIQKLSRVLS